MNRYGLQHVADMDLSKCFDRLDRGLILESVNRKISDGKVLSLIRKFLKAGVLKDGAWEETEIGSPQGGVISPLLWNIYLDRFDQAMKAQRIRIVRYADDILIFARSPRQIRRFRDAAVKVLEEDLRLVTSHEKTHLTHVREGVPFLGLVIWPKWVTIHPKRLRKLKDRIRELTPRNSGRNVQQLVKELNKVLRGWIAYFRLANCKGLVAELMGWVRRRLRMKQMREWKSWQPLHRRLRQLGYQGEFEKISMRGWRNSASPLISMALPNQWLHEELKLVDLTRYEVGILHRYVT